MSAQPPRSRGRRGPRRPWRKRYMSWNCEKHLWKNYWVYLLRDNCRFFALDWRIDFNCDYNRMASTKMERLFRLFAIQKGYCWSGHFSNKLRLLDGLDSSNCKDCRDLIRMIGACIILTFSYNPTFQQTRRVMAFSRRLRGWRYSCSRACWILRSAQWKS